MKRSLLLFLISLPVFALSPYQLESETLGKKKFQLQLSAEMFSSKAKYDHQGNKSDFNDGEGFKRLQGGIKATYGIFDAFDLFIGLNGRYNHAKTSGYDLENSGIESYFAGFKFNLGKVPNFGSYTLQAAFSLEAGKTDYENKSYTPGTAPTDTIILGDDGAFLSAGIDLSLASDKNGFFAIGAHYLIPPNDLSHEINYFTEFAYQFEHSALIAGVRGVISMKNDDYSDDKDEKPDMSVGATNLYNSINRAYFMPYAGVNYAFGTIRLQFELGYVASGTSTDQGYQVATKAVWGI